MPDDAPTGRSRRDEPDHGDGVRRREVSRTLTRLTIDHLRDEHGDEAVAAVAERLGGADQLRALADEHRWCTHRELTELLDAAAHVTGNPDIAFAVGRTATDSRAAAGVKLLLQAVGSPQQVFRMTGALPRIFPVARLEPLEVRSGFARLEFGIEPGLPVSRHDCGLVRGIVSATPCLFGLPPATVSEPVCRTDGASSCVLEASWQPSTWWGRLTGRTERQRAEVAATQALSQLRSLQSTLEVLVEAGDVDAVLRTITERAAVAVRSTGFVLAIELEGEVRIHADGLDRDRAEAIAARLLDSGPTSATPLVADVQSSTRHYGRLAAIGPAMLPGEQELLTAYGRLTAVALDAITALATAQRRQVATAALLRLARTLARADHDEVAEALAGAVPDLVEADACVVLLRGAASADLVAAATQSWPKELDGLQAPTTDDAVADALAAPRPRFHEPDGPLGALLDASGLSALASVAILVEDDARGLICAGWETPPPEHHTEGVLLRLAGVADQAATALDRAELIARIDHEASHDTLTGLANRRQLEEDIEAALARWRRTGEPFGLLFLDLDGFKSVNDQLGHAAGDELLATVADQLRDEVRATDTAARFGGDEFVVLLAGAADEDALQAAAQHVRDAVLEPLPLRPDAPPVDVSIGTALVARDGEGVEELLRRADAEMYAAKAGRRG